MSSLDSLVRQVLDKLGLGDVASTDCKLFLNKKEITDLSTPLRLLGLPRGAKLDLITGREPKLGVQETTAINNNNTQHDQEQQSHQPSITTNAPIPSSSTQPPPPPTTTTTAFPPSSSSVQQHTIPQPSKEESTTIHPVFGKYGHSMCIFTRQAELDLEASLAAATTTELGTTSLNTGEDDDSFFEFTEADFRRVQASAAAKRAKEASSTLMTKTMREAQEKKNAQLVGDVIIRAELPNNSVVVQVTVPATETLGELKRLIFSVLDSTSSTSSTRSQPQPPVYLYTTPPKMVLKDDDKMLYSLGLYPAARVHVGLHNNTSSSSQLNSSLVLRSEAQALVGPPPSKADVMHKHKGGKDKQGGGGGGDGKGKEAATTTTSTTTTSTGRPTLAGGKPVPKWLKLAK